MKLFGLKDLRRKYVSKWCDIFNRLKNVLIERLLLLLFIFIIITIIYIYYKYLLYYKCLLY